MKRLLTFQRGLWNTIRSFISLKENSDFEIDEKDTRKTMLKFDEESYDIRNYYLKSITHAFELHRPDLALENILRMHSGLAYLVPEIAFRCLQYEKALATLILSSFPLMPHLSSELWSRLSKVCKSIDYDMNKNIHEQKWPEVDMAYSLDLNMFVNGKDCGYYQIKRDQLESLSSEQAIEMAFDCQYVTNAIGSQPVSTVQYTYVKQCEGRVAIETEGYISK